MATERTARPASWVLDKPESDLAQIVDSFREAGDSVWHIDRHVLEVTEPATYDPEAIVAACAAGLSLLRQWSSHRVALTEGETKVSEPYLIIDDEWLDAAPGAPPPHVYICLSSGQQESIKHEPHVDMQPLPNTLAHLLKANETIVRIGGAFEGEPSTAWLIKPAIRSE
ncbi:hypothetical protein [Microvirga guangxiensis]|uniref:Uncharacterized protein n=1 Tax=Microvirga guangxiensis TaxID=549386 RepID=A0A1G5LGR1_9HYPH|nr:hypothetical protein [Microvirga guangxiensis]SCZ11651.1 hypothetical protein SAMN02927923_04270 [Microvirga guangxiensis]